MKIFFNPTTRANHQYNNQRPCYFKRETKNDVCIKNNNISFNTKKFDETYPLLKRDIKSYIANAPEISLGGIEEMLNQHLNDIVVKNFEDAPDDISKFTLAYFEKFIRVVKDYNGNIKIINLPQKGCI